MVRSYPVAQARRPDHGDDRVKASREEYPRETHGYGSYRNGGEHHEDQDQTYSFCDIPVLHFYKAGPARAGPGYSVRYSLTTLAYPSITSILA